MRHVLLVAYDYPPRQSNGSVRPAGLAKFLPRFGWEPIVLTSQLPAGMRPPARVLETQYRNPREAWKRKLGLDATLAPGQQLSRLRLPAASNPHLRRLYGQCVKWGRSVTTYPDAFRGWIPSALQAVGEIARKERIDAIVSTGPPASCHLIARRAKAVCRCVWVADFRDPWANNPYSGYGKVRCVLDERLERRTLGEADALVATSTPVMDLLRQHYWPRPCYWIPNGFDPDEFPRGSRTLSRQFSITHTGTLYEGKRNPELLFDVIRDLIRAGIVSRSSVRIQFYGPLEPWLAELVQRYGLKDVVELHGVVPRSVALKAQRESQILLLMRWDDPAEAGFLSGKLFEYMGSRRPIVALGGPPGGTPEILTETRSGIHVTSRSQLRAFLLAAYESFRRTGSVHDTGNEAAINRYTHPEMARRFAQVLDLTVGQERTDWPGPSEQGSAEVPAAKPVATPIRGLEK